MVRGGGSGGCVTIQIIICVRVRIHHRVQDGGGHVNDGRLIASSRSVGCSPVVEVASRGCTGKLFVDRVSSSSSTVQSLANGRCSRIRIPVCLVAFQGRCQCSKITGHTRLLGARGHAEIVRDRDRGKDDDDGDDHHQLNKGKSSSLHCFLLGSLSRLPAYGRLSLCLCC